MKGTVCICAGLITIFNDVGNLLLVFLSLELVILCNAFATTKQACDFY